MIYSQQATWLIIVLLLCFCLLLIVALVIFIAKWVLLRKKLIAKENKTRNHTPEEIIKERNTVVSTVFSSFPFQMWITDTSGKYTYMNPVAIDFWGNHVNSNISDVKCETAVKERWLKNHAMILNDEVVCNQVSYLKNEKQNHFIEVLTPLKLNEVVVGSLGANIDITAQKEAELAITVSEVKFHSIFNNSPDTISLVDYETGQYIDVNDCYLRIIGKSRNEVIGFTREQLGVWANNDERLQYETLLYGNGSVKNFEMQWSVQSGFRQFLVSSEIIDLDGRRVILTISKDVELLYQMQNALAKSEAKFRTIFDASSDAIIITTMDQRFIEVNEAFLRMTGYTREELVLMRTFQLVSAEYHDQIRERMVAMYNGNAQPPIELEVKNKNNEQGWIEMNGRIVEYNNQMVFLSHIRDIDERKFLAKKSLQLIVESEENERRRLAFDLHDDVGPLLSSLNMYVSLLARRPEIEKYNNEITNIQTILKDTIAAVRAISNNISPHVLKMYGLNAALTNFFEANGQLISIKFRNDFANIRFSETLEITLYRIIKELFNNTIKYAKASNCEVSLQNIENKILLFYADNGCGFNWDETLEKNRKNLGLLSIVNRVRTMEGNYVVETSPENGFRITITLKQ